jgi:HEAT repeat protein
VRTAAKTLARRPPDVPAAPITRRRGKAKDRTSPLALGSLFETFFREDDSVVRAHVASHTESPDAIVREAAALMSAALGPKTTSARAKDLARRRRLALRAAKTVLAPTKAETTSHLDLTRSIVAHIDANPMPPDATGPSPAREEALFALSELGDRAIVPVLVARAITGDVSAVDMLGALADSSIVPHLVGLLERDPRARPLTTATVRALAALDAREATPVLRRTLELNPMTNWREGLERTVLVQALVSALGTLEDDLAGPLLVSILESTSLEYRAILPTAAWALGRIRHLPALTTLERLLCSPKETVTCEALWAVGAIGAAHESARTRAAALLEAQKGLEPGAEVTRLAALAKMKKGAAKPAELRRAIDNALWEPAFRQEETSRRRVWAFRAIADLDRSAYGDLTVSVLRHETIRYFLTRDNHRVRRAAEEAFTALGVSVPTTRRYFSFVLDDLERRVGLEGLHDAVRDPLGVFRHNVATRIAERGDPSSARPLAEATARLFSEPPTSTYEYDDAPPHLVAFVRALAKLNCPEGNDVLIEGLRSGNHQVRAVIAENAPDDERIVPELMAMLGDPRSFLRSRAERSLTSLGAIEPSDAVLSATTEGATVRVEV